MGKYQGICMVAGSYNKSMFSFISGYKLFSEVAIQFLNLFSSSIVDLQSCVNFCCTLKWFSYTYVYNLFIFSIMIYHRVLNIVPWAIQ